MHWKYKDYFAPVAIDMVHAENASETMQGSMLLLLKKNLIYDLYGAKSSGATVCFYPWQLILFLIRFIFTSPKICTGCIASQLLVSSLWPIFLLWDMGTLVVSSLWDRLVYLFPIQYLISSFSYDKQPWLCNCRLGTYRCQVLSLLGNIEIFCCLLGLLGENQNTRVESLQLEDEMVIKLVLVTLRDGVGRSAGLVNQEVFTIIIEVNFQ